MRAEVAAAHNPQVLVPYRGPDPDPDCLDVFLYLRPESNGVQVESTILSVIQACGEYRSGINLIYMANIPGDYIVRNRIVERHYAMRLFFAVHGGGAFSADMIRQFEAFYAVPFRQQTVMGAFEALHHFGWQPEDLFALWVEEKDVTRIAGQVVKRYQGLFIVNYDIPALLHKNNTNTDIAVMAFRTQVGYRHFFGLADQMREALVERGLLRTGLPIARAVHFSRSPFEQLVDARDYLLRPDGTPAELEDSSFARFLMERGIPAAVIRGLIDHPICIFDFDADLPVDQHLLELCEGFTYNDGYHILRRMRAQSLLPGHLLM